MLVEIDTWNWSGTER